ncbi:FAD-dependent oxidoreductase [Stenotrophomonas sp.]|uniref:FAD-dependent oxidoreductase n=1 Tax=Stenotrophomonas sp. TaxID=69392 RepID=UPI002FC9FA95
MLSPSPAHDYDLVVVGASFAGAACALAAAQYGLRVCVLERKAAGSGSPGGCRRAGGRG